MPPLPRPFRRLILMASLLLLVGGGAVVNVAVAWVLAARGGLSGPTVADVPTWHVSFDRYIPYQRTDAYVFSHHRSFGMTLSLEKDGPHICGTRAAGWPLRSMAMSWYVQYVIDETQERNMLRLWQPAPRRRFVEGAVPTRPLPAGFAINTLFYTAILALPLSVFPLRRRLRARRGRCPKCGYDLAGLAGAEKGAEGAPCPECGATR